MACPNLLLHGDLTAMLADSRGFEHLGEKNNIREKSVFLLVEEENNLSIKPQDDLPALNSAMSNDR